MPPFTRAVSRRLRASGAMSGDGTAGSRIPSRSSSSSRSSASASGARVRICSRASLIGEVRPLRRCPEVAGIPRGRGSPWHATRRTSSTPQPRGQLAIAASSATSRLLPTPGGATSPTTAPEPAIDRSSTPVSAASSHCRPTRVVSRRPMAPCSATPSRRRAGTGCSAPLMRTNSGSPSTTVCIDEPCGGLAEHHPAGRCRRFHPLGHADLFADGGVSASARTDLAGNHLTGIQSYPKLQIDTVTCP